MDTIFLHRDLTAGDFKNERGEVTGPNYVGSYEGKTTESAVEFNYDKTLIVGCVDSETITNQSQAVVLAFQEFQSLISEAELPPMPGTKLNFSCVFSATVVNDEEVTKAKPAKEKAKSDLEDPKE